MGTFIIFATMVLSWIFAEMLGVDVFHLPLDVMDYATGIRPVIGNIHTDTFGLIAALLFWSIAIAILWSLYMAIFGLRPKSKKTEEEFIKTWYLLLPVVLIEEIVFRGIFTGLLGNMASAANLGVHVGAVLFAVAHVSNYEEGGWLAVVPMFFGHYFASYFMAFLHASFSEAFFWQVLALGLGGCIMEHFTFDMILVLATYVKRVFALESV